MINIVQVYTKKIRSKLSFQEYRTETDKTELFATQSIQSKASFAVVDMVGHGRKGHSSHQR